MEKVGGGKWAEIKKMKYRESDPLERRSAVDLKDKWRNLQAILLPEAPYTIHLHSWTLSLCTLEQLKGHTAKIAGPTQDKEADCACEAHPFVQHASTSSDSKAVLWQGA